MAESDLSSEVNATTVLPAPSNLTASVADDNNVDLSWTDNSSDEDGFRIYRRTGSSSTNLADYTQIDSVGSNVTSYEDTSVSDGTEYHYRVTAYTTDAESSPTNDASAETLESIWWTTQTDWEDSTKTNVVVDGSQFKLAQTVTVLDSFEDGGITEYSGDTGSYSVGISFSYDGSLSLGSTSDQVWIFHDNKSISTGEEAFGYYAWPTYENISGRTPEFAFGMTDTSSGSENGYVISPGPEGQSIYRYDNGSSTELTSSSVSLSRKAWNEIRVTQWDGSGNITVEMYDSSETLVTTLSTTDSTYSGTTFGFRTDNLGGNDVHWDYVYKDK